MRSLLGVLTMGLIVIVVATANQPVPVGVTASDSMTPTLGVDETFLAIPPTLLGEVSEGDIAVFSGDDGWTVHRIVSIADGSAVTAGDANIITDQQAGAPPVPVDSIVGVIPEIGGRTLSIDVSMVPISRLHLGIVGAMLVLYRFLRFDQSTSSVSPVLIGVIAAGIVVVAWVLDPPTYAPVASVVENRGPIPLVVFSETPARASIIWPTQTSGELTTGVRTVPGIAPSSLVSIATSFDPRLGVGVVAMTTGVLTSVVLAVIGWGVER